SPLCSFGGVQSGGQVTGISPGSEIDISCSRLPDSTGVVLAEQSELAEIAPPGDEIDEVDTGDLKFVTTTSTGSFTTTFTIPESFKAADPNAQCSPTQTQQNAGLVGCTV